MYSKNKPPNCWCDLRTKIDGLFKWRERFLSPRNEMRDVPHCANLLSAIEKYHDSLRRFYMKTNTLTRPIPTFSEPWCYYLLTNQGKVEAGPVLRGQPWEKLRSQPPPVKGLEKGGLKQVIEQSPLLRINLLECHHTLRLLLPQLRFLGSRQHSVGCHHLLRCACCAILLI